MIDIPFETKSNAKKLISKATREDHIIKKEIQFHGHNKDLVEPYFWHLQFPYYTGKGYLPIKLEDQHYFSENSQFGAQFRQLKGGSIRAFQENLQQLIQLIKVHMMPLLKEIKAADEYKSIMDTIVENDDIYQKGLEQGKTKEDPLVRKAVEERDEAILHLKDKWVSEVDGGRMWQMQRSQTEQGLDMVLLPQLFFGTKLDNPLYLLHEKGKSLKEQLDDYIYKVDITQDAINAVARFQYRFYAWLPSAVKEVTTEFKIKVATLKQFYSQLQMYIKFMKPLLLEVAKKAEGFEKTSAYYNFEEHNPDFWNLLDYSYSYVRVLGVKGILKERGGESLEILRFCNFGYYLPGKYVQWGKYRGRSGIITQEIEKEGVKIYKFKLLEGGRDFADKLTKDEFNKLEEVELLKTDLKLFSAMEYQFSQKRRTEVVQTQQGPQQVPFNQNKILYTGFAWNLYEIATYKESLRQDELDLLENFIEELSVIKDDLLHYVGILEKTKSFQKSSPSESTDSKSQNNSLSPQSSSPSLITAPIEGLGVLVSALFPFISNKNNSSSGSKNHSSSSNSTNSEKLESNQIEEIEIIKADIAEDTWKLYTIFKKTHGYMQY